MSHAESKTVHSTFLPPGSPDRRAGSSQIWGLTFTPSVNKAATADRLSTKYPQKSLKGGQITRSWHTGAKWRDSLQIEGVNSQNPFVFQQQQYDNTHVINRVTHCCHYRPCPTGKPDQDPGTDPQDPWLASQPTTGIMHGPDPQEDPGADNDGDCLLSTNGAVIAKSSCRLTQASYLFRILPLLRGGSVDS